MDAGVGSRRAWALGVGALLVAWSTLAGGGAYRWAGLVTVALAIVLLLLARPRVAARPDTRPLDICLVLALAAAGLQLVPLPPAVRWALSPQVDVDRLTLLLMPDAASRWTPVSLGPSDTVYANALVAAAVGVFWSCRHLLGRGSAHPLMATVALVGLVGSAAAFLQRTIDPTRLYGVWLPLDEGARPFGPFVNRNHFGTWLLLALPLTAGWLTSLVPVANGARSVRREGDTARLVESRLAWVGVSMVAMTIALVATASRGALVALGAEVVVLGLLAAAKASTRAIGLALLPAALLAAIVASTVSSESLLDRVEETLARGTAERRAIWQDTRRVVTYYPLTGTGLGTFERAMLVHQSSDRRTRTNQAHSQYWQLAAEGGAALILPALAVCAAFLWLAVRRLRVDTDATAWWRVGALVGVCGVAVQGIWETGLRMPANGMLLALAAAVAVHRSRARGPEGTRVEPPSSPRH